MSFTTSLFSRRSSDEDDTATTTTINGSRKSGILLRGVRDPSSFSSDDDHHRHHRPQWLYRPTKNNSPSSASRLVKELLSNQQIQEQMSDEELVQFFLSLSMSDRDEDGQQQQPRQQQQQQQQQRQQQQQQQSAVRKCTSSWDQDENMLMRKAYHRRRREIRQWAIDLKDDKARIDQDGRLVPVTEPPQPPRADLPPPIPPGGNINNMNNNNNNNPFLGNNMNNNHNNREQQEEEWLARQRRDAAAVIARAVQSYRNEGIPEDDFELILLDGRGNVVDATAANAAVNGGRDGGGGGRAAAAVGGGGGGRAAAAAAGIVPTLRRILLGLFAALVAFACLVLQTLPLLSTTSQSETLDPNFDKLLYELLHVRFLHEHYPQCPGLDRSKSVPTSPTLFPSNVHSTMMKWVGLNKSPQEHNDYDCSDQVLHIPAKHVLRQDFERATMMAMTSSTKMDDDSIKKVMFPYSDGVDVSWFLPCAIGPQETYRHQHRRRRWRRTQSTILTAEGKEDYDTDNVCTNDVDDHHHQHESDSCNHHIATKNNRTVCFRGIHDNLITNVGDALTLAAALIAKGGDHFDVYYDIQLLQKQIPSIMKTLKTLLEDRYLNRQQQQQQQDINDRNKKRATGSLETTTMTTTVKPVAFRILTTGPMDGYGVDLYRSPASALNVTNYIDWIERSKEQNEMAHYSLPMWPFRIPAKRDSCTLMADLDSDDRFAIRTAVFLSDGSQQNFRGGSTLFVDHDPSNRNPKRKIRKGITIDPSVGRVVVSTGGYENLQCRLPTRAGLRAVLQIWWDYDY